MLYKQLQELQTYNKGLYLMDFWGVNVKNLHKFTFFLQKTKHFFKSKNVIVISFPKSGRTWLRVMLDRLNISLRYSHDESEHTRKISYNNLTLDKSKYKKKKIIFLVRDPLDTVVSSYFQSVKRIKVFNGTISDFIRDERYGMQKILRFHNIWHNNKHIPKDFLLIRYENMHKKPLNVLENIMSFLQIQNISDNRLKESIEFAKFENMHKLEKEGFYEKKYGIPLYLTDKNEKESFKIRKGKIGGYVDYLNEEDINYCKEYLLKMKNPFY